MKMNFMDGTCAIIQIEGKALVVQRRSQMKLPLKWEFPGGKIEPGESAEACIKREIREELGIEIVITGRLATTLFDYTDFSIRLIPFLAEHLEGVIHLKEHKPYVLFDKNELRKLDWAEADIPIVNEFIAL